MHSPVAPIVVAFATLVFVSDLFAAESGTDPSPPLFQPVPTSDVSRTYDDAAAVRQRNVELPAQLLGGVESLELELFDGEVVTALHDSTQRAYGGGHIASYRIVGDLYGQADFSVVGEAVSATIRTSDRLFKLNHVGAGQHTLSQVDDQRQPLCGTGPASGDDSQVESGQRVAMASTDYTIDVMVVSTNNARSANGGQAGITSLINLAVYETNESYSQSGVQQRLNLVLVHHASYSEGGSDSTYLNHLKGTSDGNMDEVHSLRNQYGADIVSLVYASGSYCGIAAGILCSLGGNWSGNAFCVVSDSCATGYYSFGHELGHLMGAQHDRANTGGCKLTNYCFGDRTASNTYRTVMAYAPGTRLPFWSNPNRVAPNGQALGAVNSEENWRLLNLSAPTVSSWRSHVDVGHELTTTFGSNGGQAGAMFDLVSTADIELTALDINTNASAGTPVSVDVWYRFGSHVGNENSAAGWVLLDSASGISAGQDNPTRIDLDVGPAFKQGQTHGLYVDLTSYVAGSHTLRYSSGSSTYSNTFLRLTTGVAKGAGFGGATIANSRWSGRVHYQGGRGASELTTTFAGGDSNAGCMFDIEAKTGVTVTSMDIHVDTPIAADVITADVWYKVGSYTGAADNPQTWKFAGSDMKARSAGPGQPTRIVFSEFELLPGQTYGIYVHLASASSGHSLRQTPGTTVYENADLKILPGLARDDEIFTGASFINRQFNGTLHYSGLAWSDLGHGKAGQLGVPALTGEGDLVPGGPLSLTLSFGRPNAVCALIVGSSEIYAPFKGGTLVPNPDALFVLVTTGLGNKKVDSNWPSGVPLAPAYSFQYWIVDSFAAGGYSASNGLRASQL